MILAVINELGYLHTVKEIVQLLIPLRYDNGVKKLWQPILSQSMPYISNMTILLFANPEYTQINNTGT